MRKLLIAGLVVLASLAATMHLAPAGADSCTVTWGSKSKIVEKHSTAPVTGARAGRHDCYDRFVVDVRGKVAGYRVSYVSQVATEGRGKVVPLRGGAKLDVVALVPAYNSSGTNTYQPANHNEAVNVAGFTTFRQIAYLGTFEGQSSWGVGVRARLPFRVTIMAGPGTGSRLVIDVAHHW